MTVRLPSPYILTLLLAFPWVLSSCAGHNEAVDAVLALAGEVAAGEVVYLDHCAECHLEDGSGDIGPSLIFHVPRHPDRYLVNLILVGEGNMPPFDDLADQDIADVLVYLRGTFGEQEY